MIGTARLKSDKDEPRYSGLMSSKILNPLVNQFLLLQDRQESAEKMASDLADELKDLQVQKDALEQRNKLLEAALLKSSEQQSLLSRERPVTIHKVSSVCDKMKLFHIYIQLIKLLQHCVQ